MSTEQDVLDAVALVKEHGGANAASKASGIPRTTLRDRVRRAEELDRDWMPAEYKEDEKERDIGELVQQRRDTWDRKSKANPSTPYRIKIKKPGPFAIACMGDWHIDDPGCNFPLLESDINTIVETPRMFAGLVGDLENAWVGRLARLWAENSLSARDALRLVEWGINQLGDKLIWITLGNHDLWTSGVHGVTSVEWIKRVNRDSYIAEPDEVFIKLEQPDGEAWTVLSRHQFPGNSMWNPAHSLGRAAQMGWRVDALVAGHFHKAGYQQSMDPMTGGVSHGVQIASYKQVDAFQRNKGFIKHNIHECPVLVFNPGTDDKRHRVVVMPNPKAAATLLKGLVDEWESSDKSTH